MPKTEEQTPKKRDEIRVALVEDRPKIRESLGQIIESSPGLKLENLFADCEQLLKNLDSLSVDVLLMDIGLPGMSGIEGVRQVKARRPEIDILMHTVYDDDDKIFQSICAGASGYVLKNAEPDELIKAIHEISVGAPMSASIARRLLAMVRGRETKKPEDLNLSPRELDILQWLVEGMSYKRIAEQLFISPLTVQSHIKRVYEKLHVHSKSAAVSKALRYKLFG